MALTPLDIIAFFEKQARRPLALREVLGGLGLSGAERRKGKALLESMSRDGTLVRLKGDRYSLPRQINLVTGTVSAHRDGYGFVVPGAGEGPDVFIPARFMREVMHGDRVAVRVEKRGRRGANPEGRVVQVLERAHTTIVGRYESGRRLGFVVPLDARLGSDLLIPPGAGDGARPGQTVVARIEIYPGKNRNPEGTVVEVLGAPDDPEVEVLTVVHQHGLPREFPPEVLEAAAECPDAVTPEAVEEREDLRELPLVTIDGESARDFDDAVAVARLDDGRIRLWVSIADVGHYVAEGGALDREALERGTSVYFPDRCIPMLPERLSNGICSLNPGVDRLTMTAELVFDEQGRRLDSRFYPSVMRSAARLTYTEVRDMLAGDDEVVARHAKLLPTIRLMAELAERLNAMRRQRGSLDFDLPEAEIILDLQGRPEDVVRAERNQAHRLIEEFMLAANEAVAEYLTRREIPLLYRVHEPPDPEKLDQFQQFVAHFNYGITLDGSGGDARRLQQLLREVEGRPEERMINQVLLRSMKQARYAPENSGHFGLAADYYCHFTSPIRRYPDLVIHRILKRTLAGRMDEKARGRLSKRLPELGEMTSRLERRAMEAEREVVALQKARFMAEKVGEEFAGIISGVQPFGFFVELEEYFVEGLVHISSLADDFYQYEEDQQRLVGTHRRRIFQVGESVRIRVVKVSIERREIDFELVEGQVEG